MSIFHITYFSIAVIRFYKRGALSNKQEKDARIKKRILEVKMYIVGEVARISNINVAD